MITLPIRQLVELILRCGDIDSRFVSRDRMMEGARAHRSLQKMNRERYEDYRGEVFLSAAYSCHGTDYTLEGRADGIFVHNGRHTIEEIKTTRLPLDMIDEEHNPAHWAQAQCYACIFAVQNSLPEMSVQLTYYHLETGEIRQFSRTFDAVDLEAFVGGLIEKYSAWAGFSSAWQKDRNASIKILQFPFPAYRKGQRELAVHAYRSIAGGQKLFAQAPTGTGKTISVLFPAIKAVGEGKSSKIFYLTAKTMTRQVAQESFEKMRQAGLKMKVLTLTAKEKICFCDKPVCRPEVCQYARGHYDRVNEAILDAIQACDQLSREAIEAYAQKHRVCPFELSLDLALLADCIICDYNYAFDPRVYLRRFFGDTRGDYIFLIDEAHNLVDRARDMFSAQLCKTDFYQVKKACKGQNKALDGVLTKINQAMIALRKKCGEPGYFISGEKDQEFIKLVNRFTGVCEVMLKENGQLSEDSLFLQLYFAALDFLAVADLYDARYTTLVEARRDEVMIKLFCLDPSFLLGQGFQRAGSAILFSATFSPLGYFRHILGGDQDDRILSMDSPFDQKHLCVMVADRLSTRYTRREQTRLQLVRLIGSFVSGKTGNYIVYFPSYKYMNDVFQEFTAVFPEIYAVEQGTALSEEEREHFLSRFNENPARTYVAFCVLGGIFAEGIDLAGSRLIGAVIVSVGLPQLSVQQNIIRDYFNQNNGLGYEYAYMYPGMNKVLQAAGRVIRSESDTGAILLIDERYNQRNYANLFPGHWRPWASIADSETLRKHLESFW